LMPIQLSPQAALKQRGGQWAAGLPRRPRLWPQDSQLWCCVVRLGITLSRSGQWGCLFSNAAIAALWALEQSGVRQVAIFDWDVHHGNGTQAVVERHPQLAYASIHQFPLYPGTGLAEETGIHGNLCNVPLPAGSDWSAYEKALQEKVLPFLKAFQPDLLLVSAGFDCAKGDPLADMLLEPEDFGRMTRLCLKEVTSKAVFGLEGGYNLENLARGWLSVAQACLEG